ncbi:MAG: UDP-glucose 4-epimerase GalE [Armatimonadetes bacterium]|nr:UDP-glucose 4-epimerase GalE [Armatimonadota bacterium]
MRIFVVGGAGYVGSHCVKRLVAAGHEVVVLDNLSAGHRRAVDPKAAFVAGDLADRPLVDTQLATGRFDAVMHFAAFLNVGESVQRPLAYWRNNVANTLNLLESMEAHGVRRFVFSSTCAVYGQPDELPIVEDLPKAPLSPYGCTKLSVEWMLQNCAVAWGLGSIALRYFNAAGAAEDGSLGEDHDPEIHLIPLVLRVALGQRESIPVFGTDYPTPDGSCIRDYIHVDDLAEAHLKAVEAVQPGQFEAFNVGTGRGYSVLEIIAAAREVTQHPIPIEVAPRRPGDPPLLFADPGRLQARFNWLPRHKDVRQVIRTAWRWMQAHPHGYGD